jgi:CelD/BcsL family acetyltransferase involved in cellulose biosynthesis
MITVHEINDSAELAALRPAWDELWERTPGASFFHSLSRLQTYWKHLGAGKRLRMLIVHDRDQVIGILPLVVATARGSEPFRALMFPLADWGNFYGPIGPDLQATLVAGLDHVRPTPRDWHFIELASVDALADGGHTKLALDNAGFAATCETPGIGVVVNLAAHDSWEAYLATRSSRLRTALRRRERRLAERGAVSYVRHRTTESEGPQADPRWDLYDACENISRASWQASVRNGRAMGKGTHRSFYRDCHLAGVRSGAADLNLHSVDGRAAAFMYCYHSRGCVTGLNIAYDPAYASKGVHNVVIFRTTADRFASSDHTLDLGPNSTDRYERQGLTGKRPLYCYVHFPAGSAAAPLVRAKRAMARSWRARRTGGCQRLLRRRGRCAGDRIGGGGKQRHAGSRHGARRRQNEADMITVCEMIDQAELATKGPSWMERVEAGDYEHRCCR